MEKQRGIERHLWHLLRQLSPWHPLDLQRQLSPRHPLHFLRQLSRRWEIPHLLAASLAEIKSILIPPSYPPYNIPTLEQ